MESQDDRREGELDEAREDGGELDGRRIGRRRAAHKIINNNRNNKTYFYFILIEKYAAEYFKGEEINDIPEKILDRYFKRVSGLNNSQQILEEFILDFAQIYNRFIKKYAAFTDYNAEDNIRQLFKKEFKTNKVGRKEAKLEDFEKLRSDGKKEIDKYIIEIYTRMRLKENDIVISEKQIQKLISRLGTVQSIISSKEMMD